jgi:hypothetical protein
MMCPLEDTETAADNAISKAVDDRLPAPLAASRFPDLTEAIEAVWSNCAGDTRLFRDGDCHTRDARYSTVAPDCAVPCRLLLDADPLDSISHARHSSSWQVADTSAGLPGGLDEPTMPQRCSISRDVLPVAAVSDSAAHSTSCSPALVR